MAHLAPIRLFKVERAMPGQRAGVSMTETPLVSEISGCCDTFRFRWRSTRGMADATSLLLGLEGLEVTGVVKQVDRVRVVDVVTADPEASLCPDCRVVSRSVKDRTVTRPRDIRYGDDPILLQWNKTRYRCVNPECARATFTESIPQVPPRRRTTTRLRTQIGRAVGEVARSVSEVAAGSPPGWACRGRLRTPPSSSTPIGYSARRRRCRSSELTRPAAVSLAGSRMLLAGGG